MLPLRIPSFLKYIGSITCLVINLTACTVFGGAAAVITPTPIPTAIIPGLQVTTTQACQVAEQGMIRVQAPQGDLISWSPSSDTVAFIASTLGSSWNVGDLNLLAAPKFDLPERIATQVAGELSWSPDGTSIAYLGLRLSDNLYTIGLAYLDGSVSKDLFPGEAARTDSYSSQKAILEWMNASRLKVFTSCGPDCLTGVDISIPSGARSPSANTHQKISDLWAVHTNHPAQIPGKYADLKGQLNWSPDEDLIAYINENGNAWIINDQTGSLYPLDIGTYSTATESDWSFDSRYLALHVDQNLKIFAFDCP
jgi:hypothetical protein